MEVVEADTDLVEDQEFLFAKKLADYLDVGGLPKVLLDDRTKRIDSHARTERETLLAHFHEDSLFSIKTARFLKDFSRYRAAPDLKTKNESFLRTAEIFRQQGIKNYFFLLQLNNPLLVGVDPYSPDLTDEQMAMIHEECRTNFWYFLREVCRLKPDLAFKANRGNISFIWNYLNHITTYMIMPRQQGKMQRNSSKVRVVPPKGSNLHPDAYWKRIGELRTGDQVIGVDGEAGTVTGVHPHGKRRLYRVTFSDGRYTDVGTEHLWTARVNNKSTTSDVWEDFNTAGLIRLLEENKKAEIPLITPEKGKKKTLKVDPYIMGLLPHINKWGSIELEYYSEEQERYIRDNLPANLKVGRKDGILTITGKRDKPINFSFEHGLPLEYLEGSLKDRISLLQGFLDEGLTVGKDLRLIAPNRVIGAQLTYLIRGLGGTCTQSGNNLTLTLPKNDYFKFRSESKRIKVKNNLYVKSVEFVGKDDCTCIEVEHENQLYITDDFIVTHNTVSVQVINFWLTYIVGRGYKSHLITLKSDNRAQFIDAIKKIRTCIPKYLVNTTWRDKDSGTYLNYKAFGDENINTLTINVPQIGEDAAGDLGRGLTVGTTTYDEPSYINHIEAIINGCAPSALTEMDNMRQAGLPHGISFITTPNTTLHKSGDFMFKKLMSATEWREKFFDSYSESHLVDRLIKASPRDTTSPSVSMVYNYMQLGKDKDWVKKTIDQLNLSLNKAKIDFLLMWVEDGENRLFDDLTREAINNVKRQVVWSKEYRESGMYVDFFHTQQEILTMAKGSYNDFFVIGMDTSSAINKDACTLIIRSIKTGKVIGVGRYKLAFLDDVASIVVDMLQTFENSLLIPERNYAHHMIDTLLITLPAKGLDPFTKIFNQVYHDPVNHQREFEEVRATKFAYRNKNFYLKYKALFGFNTTSKSREILYGLIQEAVGITGYGINYDKLADELINLRTKGDRIDHDSKQHDDLVIAWLLTYWFIKLGDNKSYYNIPTGIALTDTRNLLNTGKQGVQQMDSNVVQMVEFVKGKVEKLTDELLNTNDNILAIRLEAEILKLSRLLPPEATKLLTIDTLVQEAKVERNKRMLKQRMKIV